MREQSGRLVFIDKTLTSTKLTRMRSCAPRGPEGDANAATGR
jgi:hypothetical protein